MVLGISVLLHLIFTPLAGWIGAGVWLLKRPPIEVVEPAQPDNPAEMAIELSELLTAPPAAPEPKAELPASDPVSLIDHIVAPAPAVKPAAAVPAAPLEKQKDPDATTTAPLASLPVPSAAPSTSSSARDGGDAGAPAPTEQLAAPSAAPSAAPQASAVAEATAPDASSAPIDNPVALIGKASALHETPASVSMVLYTDRIRGHELGRRVALLLPQLPQWDEFFGEGALNPVQDFDRLLMFGPGFVRSADLVVAVQYNVPQRKIRSAVDQMVRRRGSWLTKLPVPAALTFADRAERLVLLPAKGLALVVPPRMQAAALALKMQGIPNAKGAEAAVFRIAKPRAPFARVGLDVPATITQMSGKITALPNGAVELEVTATDVDAETAERSAAQMMQSINSAVDLLTGVSNVLSRFGFGGFGAGARMPRITLEATGKEIHGRQVLQAAQVAFILDRIERQVASMRERAKPAGAAPGASTVGGR
jgi:hypothetical protein